MKPEAAMNDLDHAVARAIMERGYTFMGADFAQPGPRDMTRLQWHFGIDGKHWFVPLDVIPEMLDDTSDVIVPVLLREVNKRLDEIAHHPDCACDGCIGTSPFHGNPS